MNFLKKIYITFSPFIVFLVEGKSMEPTFFPGKRLLGISSRLVTLHRLDTIICRDPRSQKLILKRITKIRKRYYFVEGDNKKYSTDSRQFGWIQKSDVIAKIIFY